MSSPDPRPAPSGAGAGEGGRLREERRAGEGFPVFALRPWEEDFPGLAAGITGAGRAADGEPADFGLTTAPSPWALFRRLDRLAGQLGFPAAAVGRQVHGDAVTCLRATPEAGLQVPGETDGLLTRSPGLLLTVTAADCVPVYLLDPESGGLGLLHAGWRGTAAGILESGMRAMEARFGAPPGRLRVHLGPAICGDCYEVGPEVGRALGIAGEDGDGRRRVDLRRVLRGRAGELGVADGAVTSSTWCTRCDADHFHSHRGRADGAGRMAAYLGWQHRGGG